LRHIQQARRCADAAGLYDGLKDLYMAEPHDDLSWMEYRTRRPLRQAAPAESESNYSPVAKTVPQNRCSLSDLSRTYPHPAVRLKPLQGAGLALPWCSFGSEVWVHQAEASSDPVSSGR